MVAGTPETAQNGGLLKALRGDSDATKIVSSVDVADIPSGQATVVFALAEQAERQGRAVRCVRREERRSAAGRPDRRTTDDGNLSAAVAVSRRAPRSNAPPRNCPRRTASRWSGPTTAVSRSRCSKGPVAVLGALAGVAASPSTAGKVKAAALLAGVGVGCGRRVRRPARNHAGKGLPRPPQRAQAGRGDQRRGEDPRRRRRRDRCRRAAAAQLVRCEGAGRSRCRRRLDRGYGEPHQPARSAARSCAEGGRRGERSARGRERSGRRGRRRGRGRCSVRPGRAVDAG